MLNETTVNFLQVMSTFQWPDPEPISYRLYYNEDGSPKFYTMEDLPGTYVEIDQATYVRGSFSVRVINNQIREISPCSTVTKLRPDNQGIPCDPNDVCVVVNANVPHTFWNLHTYETN